MKHCGLLTLILTMKFSKHSTENRLVSPHVGGGCRGSSLDDIFMENEISTLDWVQTAPI